ncbi:hypothetical protein ACR77X_10720 [Bacteroides salyersiae]|uniref:hypothetical protein n=1 Tax=Bacteroides salyersiae TaxID=291644 RepID=UPI003DA36075
MCKDKQTIHYCTILSAGQWDFLLDGRFSAIRQKCLHRLMTDAVRTKATYKIKGIEIVLEVGQAAASDVELAEYLRCNRKTVGKLIDSFNRLGMLTTRTNNRTSIHTLHFLTGWYVDGVLITNPHYVRPSATAKGQTGDVRTPLSNDLPLESVQSIVPGDRQSEVRDADGTTAFFSSLCSPDISDPSANGQAIGLSDADRAGNTHIIVGGEGSSGDNSEESPKEAQDGTIGGEDEPNIGKMN